MTRFSQRTMLIASFALAMAALSMNAIPAKAQTGWEYSEELGGWLDWDTGLVWAERSAGLVTWDKANNYVNNLSNNSGLPWRLPTVAESQLAGAHGIIARATITGTCWTSDAKTKGSAKTSHYAVIFYDTGAAPYEYSNGSLIQVLAVYSAFAPETPSRPGKGKK